MSNLSEAMDFDHVIEVMPDGTWHTASGLYAPEALDVDNMATELDGWALPLSGFTGQYGYTGPWLHDSEVIEGGVEMYVLEHPGYWVAIYGQHNAYEPEDVNYDDGEYIVEGWTLAFKAVTA